MQWQVVLAIVIAVPVIMLPVALVWYLTLGGMYAAAKEARQHKAARRAVEEVAG